MSEFRIVAAHFDDYRKAAHSIAAMHGRHADSVSIPDERDTFATYHRVLKVCDCGCDTEEAYAVFALRPNASGESYDFGGFTSIPGYGSPILDHVIGYLSRIFTRLTLDCFDKGGFLPALYASQGFEEYAREPYDVDTYGPLRDGSTPDVVFMRRFI